MAEERYPGFDVLQQASHWDDVTRALVVDRVERVPEIRFFTQREAATLHALCDHITAQDREPRIPVLAYVDEKLYDGPLDGYRYADMPDDPETWRRVARGLDEEAEKRGAATYAALHRAEQLELCRLFARGELSGGTWDSLNVSRAFGVVMRQVCEAFYSHPWAWNEIGFPGPAYPRGYASFGSPHLDDESEAWEPKEVRD
jgi:Gluconate 2-dehydrogenase subunit 3